MTVTFSARRLLVVLLALALASAALLLGSGGGGAGRAIAASAPGSVSCTGSAQGTITKSTVNGVPNTVQIIVSSHGVNVPIDSASGQASGKRQHRPITFSKVTDISSVGLLKAMTTNENLTSCVFRYYVVNANGTITNYYTVTINNAHVSAYSFSHSSSDTENWSLVYQTIKWQVGAAVLQDTWATPA
ncbi:MAG: type secretion system secreted protein Hcp [Frankiales bacterium]|jgi:type VI secretion system Hcp family effector|nr:type secretion system secreted protein Hcp [Frankiales bacterium]